MKASPRWSFMSVFKIGRPGDLYLWRLRIFECPWFGIYLHAIHRADKGRDLHDHPWSFVSFVLRGGYVEEVSTLSRPDGHLWPAWSYLPHVTRRVVRWFNFKRANEMHRIDTLDRTPTWTLVLRGPRGRRWGFLTRYGWVDADDYDAGELLLES